MKCQWTCENVCPATKGESPMIDIDKIYNEDCLEGLARLEDNSVDLICMDPPYCVGTTSNGLKGSFLDNNLIAPFFKQLFSQCQRVLKAGGVFT